MVARILAWLTGAVALGAVPTTAQLVDVEMSPFIGVYAPLRDLTLRSAEGSVAGVPVTADVQASQEATVTVGGRVSVVPPGPLMFEAAFGFAPSDVTSSVRAAGTVLDPAEAVLDGYVWLASARALASFGPRTSLARAHVGGGVAMVGRGGDAARLAEEGTKIGAVVGASVHAGTGWVRFRFDAESYLYSVRLSTPDARLEGFVPESRLQVDVVLTTAIVLHVV